ncbi:hypothetical protein AAFF_G00161190 [Aldrovandia affinis]|uniref:Elongin-A n=1 Tax=Aldrovandia affinis TaxID=143900 RepID=A0AAD7RN15_9TELE|nr:hypothetical protein AAFF_G00161190 [Aldrovandia affinis]
MAAADVSKKVLQLKSQLKESSESKTILKTLKRLQELDITLNILADTGIGKAVNAFRKHADAGEVAKSLVVQWKKLLSKESASPAQDQSGAEEGCQKEEEQMEVSEKKCFDGKGSESASLDTEDKPEGSHNRAKATSKHESCGGESYLDLKSATKMDQNKKVSSPKSSRPTVEPPAGESKSRADWKRKVCGVTNGQEAKSSQKTKNSTRVNETALECEKKTKPSDERETICGEDKKLDTVVRKTKMTKKGCVSTNESQPGGEECGKPTMSFESCLSYDLKAPKRKKKPCDTKKTAKKLKTTADRVEPPRKTRTELPKRSFGETPKMPTTGSVMELLNIPLPKFLPECEELNSFPYFEKKYEEVVCAVREDTPVFTGQRLNKKMLVYSGAKTTFLPGMMSLYQQCLRALQNNIDLLYEIGGVPFEILEPVLERCTPKQLLRIEECNPVYVGETDHLWERHCQRDFRNGSLEEYESWREMHLRLSEERERKLQKLTESIASAHSGKPKGRQVKLAFINSVAKPPRNVRIQQELHGTAGPVVLLNPPDRPRPLIGLDLISKVDAREKWNVVDLNRAKPSDGRVRPSCSEVTAASSQGQDPRKMKRVAPMMAKSLKAFKKQLGRR